MVAKAKPLRNATSELRCQPLYYYNLPLIAVPTQLTHDDGHCGDTMQQAY